MLSVVSNNILNIPLFHATSTLFLNSILEHGLGGKNIVNELNVLDNLQEIYNTAERLLLDDNEWQSSKFVPKKIIDQEVSGQSSNFRHGGSYLTPSRDKATYYANASKYGSEIVSQFFYIVELVKSEMPSNDVNSILRRDYPEMLVFYDKHPRPLVIKVNGIPLDYLRTEDGRPPDQQVEEMDEFLRSKLEENRRNREIQRKAKRGVNAAYVKVLMQPDKYKKTEQEVICETADIYWGQHNFELIKPVTIEERDIIYSNP